MNNQRSIEDQTYPKVNTTSTKKEKHLEKLRDALKGKSLDIYYYLNQNHQYFGVREIQRIFGYSSPNLAQYHLQRLYEAELIEKNDQNQYKIIDDPIKLGKLQDQVRIASTWIPHTFLYAITLVILAVSTVIFYIFDFNAIIYPIIYVPILLMLSVYLIKDGRKMLLYYTNADEE